MSLEQLIVLRDRASTCKRCRLHENRTNVVFGVGNTRAPSVMLLGEAPGEYEDLAAEPFVGRSGKLLMEWLAWVGLERDSVYITNVVLCRPSSNRRPLLEEVDSCREFMLGQLKLVSPRIIVVLGATAARSILSSTAPITRLRGIWHSFLGHPVRVTYHPSYILRDPTKLKMVQEDFSAVGTFLSSNV